MRGETVVLYSLVAVLWMKLAWHIYLGYRQCQNQQMTGTENLPKMVTDIYDEKRLDKARQCSFQTIRFWIILFSVETTVDSIFLMIRIRAKLWAVSKQIVHHLHLPDDEIVVSITYLTALRAIADVISLPFVIYYAVHTNCGSKRKQLNYDKIFSLIFNGQMRIIVMPFMTVFWYIPRLLIVRKFRTYNFVILWLHSILVQLIATIAIGEIARKIATHRCPQGMAEDFHAALVNLTESSNQCMSNIYHLGKNCSNISGTFNTAYTAGVIHKSVFVSSEMSAKCLGEEGLTNDEMVAVVAHEIGHLNHEDEWRFMLFFAITSFFEFMSLYILYPQPLIYQAFGFYSEQPVIIGLTGSLLFVLQPYTFVVKILENIESRKHELLADAFSAKLTSACNLRTALIKIHKFNYEFPTDDPLHSFFENSHPTLMDRLKALKR